MSVPSSEAVKERATQWRGGVLAVFLLLLAGGVAYWLGSWHAHWNVPNAGLVVADEALYFGDVWEQNEFVWELPIENPTSEEINILKFFSSCICQKIEPESLVLPPGSTEKVRLTLDLTYYTSEQKDAPVRSFAEQLVPLIEGSPAQQRGWQIRGRVRAMLTPTPRSIDFGEYSAESPADPQSFHVRVHPEIKTLKADWDSSLIAVSVSKNSATKNSFKITVNPDKKSKSGTFQIPVYLRPTTSSGEILPATRFMVHGRILHDVVLSQENLVIGASKIGTTADEFVTLQSHSNTPFDIEVVVSNSKSVSIVERMSPSDAERRFQIRVQTTELGPQRETVRFNVSPRENHPATHFNVEVRYHGIP